MENQFYFCLIFYMAPIYAMVSMNNMRTVCQIMCLNFIGCLIAGVKFLTLFVQYPLFLALLVQP